MNAAPRSYIALLTYIQDTLIVWTEAATMIDMALSFQESDGCAAIWLVESECALAGNLEDMFANLVACV